jgi:hypothetical protein
MTGDHGQTIDGIGGSIVEPVADYRDVFVQTRQAGCLGDFLILAYQKSSAAQTAHLAGAGGAMQDGHPANRSFMGLAMKEATRST